MSFVHADNAGGFGAGIVLLEDRPALEAALSSSAEVAATGDGITLLQEYCEPEDGAVFRVWVCGSRIQCAVRVQGAGITGACMSSKCTVTSRNPGAACGRHRRRGEGEDSCAHCPPRGAALPPIRA